MLLTPDHQAIREAVRDFAQTELWPHAARWDRLQDLHKDDLQ